MTTSVPVINTAPLERRNIQLISFSLFWTAVIKTMEASAKTKQNNCVCTSGKNARHYFLNTHSHTWHFMSCLQHEKENSGNQGSFVVIALKCFSQHFSVALNNFQDIYTPFTFKLSLFRVPVKEVDFLLMKICYEGKMHTVKWNL